MQQPTALDELEALFIESCNPHNEFHEAHLHNGILMLQPPLQFVSQGFGKEYFTLGMLPVEPFPHSQ